MSRLHRIGNIYTRIENLIRQKHVQEAHRPLWFDVYKQFPPKYDPTFKRMEPEMEIREIFYKEDALRAKIHKTFEGQLGVFNLQDNKESFSEKLLKSCLESVSQGMSEDEAVKKLENLLKNETNVEK